MPLVTARLPVLEPSDVGEDVGALDRVEGVLFEEGGQLGAGGILELLEAGGEQIVDEIGGARGSTSRKRSITRIALESSPSSWISRW